MTAQPTSPSKGFTIALTPDELVQKYGHAYPLPLQRGDAERLLSRVCSFQIALLPTAPTADWKLTDQFTQNNQSHGRLFLRGRTRILLNVRAEALLKLLVNQRHNQLRDFFRARALLTLSSIREERESNVDGWSWPGWSAAQLREYRWLGRIFPFVGHALLQRLAQQDNLTRDDRVTELLRESRQRKQTPCCIRYLFRLGNEDCGPFASNEEQQAVDQANLTVTEMRTLAHETNGYQNRINDARLTEDYFRRLQERLHEMTWHPDDDEYIP